jgi:hypothetical protein
MKKLAPLIGIFIIFSLISCKKVNDDPIIGEWQWFKTTSGQILITSESVDSTYYIEFGKTGIYYLFDNSKKIINTHKFELGEGRNPNVLNFSESDIVDFKDGYMIQNDILSIWNLYGFITWTSYYKRIK